MVASLPFHCLQDQCGQYHRVQVPPFKKTLTDAMPYIDYLFGNETEAAAFAESEGWKDMGVPDIAQAVSPALQLLHRTQAFLDVGLYWQRPRRCSTPSLHIATPALLGQPTSCLQASSLTWLHA